MMKHHGRCVCIVGPNRLQNELMAALIEARTGAACHLFGHPAELAEETGGADAPRLLLYDHGALSGALPPLSAGDIPVYYNVAEEAAIEEEALGRGVLGFIYLHDGATVLLRALDALFAGEIWASRRVMNACLRSGRHPLPGEGKLDSGLTHREGEILRLLSLGESNRTIAETFCISPHTVKTHIYNIFKKIKVHNRLQAAHWASRHLHDPSVLRH